MSKCAVCGKDMNSCVDLKLNEDHVCHNCILEYIMFHKNELLDINILKDSEYEYVLSKDILINFIKHNLTQQEYRKLKQKYPESFFLHDDFYDEDGNSFQPIE